MPSCATCGTFIVFGGAKDQGLRFCNSICQKKYHHEGIDLRSQIPTELIQQHAAQLHRGNCPECQGPGPVDVHHGHQVWSYLIATQWRSVPKVCCRGCAQKHQLVSAGISAVAGWWGFPWGLLMTPFQIGRNAMAMMGGPDPRHPSPLLYEIARSMIASQIAENGQQIEVLDQPLSEHPIPTSSPPQTSNNQNPYSYQ